MKLKNPFQLLCSILTFCLVGWSVAFGADHHVPILAGVTTLGLFGTGNFETGEVPEDWRTTILYLFPNGDAPLTALLSMMDRPGTKSSHFNWWEKGLQSKTTTLTGAQTNVATNLVVADSTGFTKDQQLYNARTGEVMVITADPADATHVVVARGAAGSTNAAINDQDIIFVIGTVYSEGTGVGNAPYVGPGRRYNYTQIFKSPVEITGSAEQEDSRTGNKYLDMKEEALRSHSVDMEMAFLFGRRYEDTGANGKPRRFTGGLDTQFITTNRFDAAGTMTKTLFNNWMEQWFAYGSDERLLLSGRRVIRMIHEMVQANTSYQIANEKVYGVRLERVTTPWGDLLLKRHPLFNSNTFLQQYAIGLDLQNIHERPFRDTEFKENAQLPDADEKKDFFISETGIEVQQEKTHAVFKNINAYTNT